MKPMKCNENKTMSKQLRQGLLVTGFTLVEILIAMAVFAIGCLAVFMLQGSAMQNASQAANLSMAVLLAESRFEQLHSMDFQTVASMASGSSNVENLTRDGEKCVKAEGESGNRCFFTRKTTVKAGFPTSRSCEVSVEVAWKSFFGEKSIVYDSVISSDSF